MYSMMVNKERKVLLPTASQELMQPYEAIYAKMSGEFDYELKRYSGNGNIAEFRLALMNYIDSLMDLYEEM